MPVDCVHAGGAVVALPARHPNDNQKPKGLNCEYHITGANRRWRCQFRFAANVAGRRWLSSWSLGISRTMSISPTFVLLGLLLTGCTHRSPGLSERIAGTWTRDADFKLTLQPDGSTSSFFRASDGTVSYQGTWRIKDSALLVTITNVVANRRHESVGSVDTLKIISVDDHKLVYETFGQAVTLTR
jgi:hypothetical protein